MYCFVFYCIKKLMPSSKVFFGLSRFLGLLKTDSGQCCYNCCCCCCNYYCCCLVVVVIVVVAVIVVIVLL